MNRLNQLPPSCSDLNLAEVEAELVKQCGNVTATAKKFGVPPPDLRKWVWSSSLADVAYEQIERALDAAYQTLLDGLKSDDKAMRLRAASILLTQSAAGKRRGWGAVGYQPTGRPLGGPKKCDPLQAH
jgi:hypothetical protein